MAAQAEPFHVALSFLRDRLHRGVLRPGSRITAVDLADDLRLSTTPVREALSRLAGAGIVEDRRGQGYFVPLPSPADIADFYRLSLAQLLIALDPRRLGRGTDASAAVPPVIDDPVEAVETLFHHWVAARGSRALVAGFRIVQVQLGPVRRLEASVLGDLSPEAAQLCGQPALEHGARLALLRQFHGRRIRAADRLAAVLEAARGPSE